MNLDLKEEDKVIVSGKKSFKQKLKDFWAVKRNRMITIVIVIILILAALATGFYFLIYKNDGINLGLDVKKEQVKPQLYASSLDGTMVSSDDANRHPLGIMVENHVDARPQSGLSQASIVYEAIAEGGITRFLAVYGPKSAAKVGPVRSARTYYVDWIRELGGYYAHVGGNYDALTMIKSVGILDLDQFANPSAYWRDTSRKVSSEHTMYTDTSKLYKIAADKKYATTNTFIPYTFKTEPDLAAIVPSIQTISINFGNANYNVSYNYDITTNSYLRNIAGKPDVDVENSARITSKNVVIQTVNRRPTTTAINESGYIMDTVGTGAATVFQDGSKIDATWKKDNENSRTRFFNKATGAEIQFNPGQTWVEVISPDLSFTAA
ncbi:MAG: DUF3048 domain-containing protein [Candidatus Berkelbacteria bacterium]|nr:DUF3048 domain-containing protein [Candidatus Berkelbacteria bacterium]